MASEPIRRPRLSRERILDASVALADREGIDSVTMRILASELGVEAMSLYYHVAGKEDLLDGMVEVVSGEICREVGPIVSNSPAEWKATLRARILAARRILLRHPWAPPLIETRTAMTPSTIGYYDELLGLMRLGGFSYDLAHHAMHALGSRALGFTQELFQPDGDAAEEASTEMLDAMVTQFPHLAGMMAEVAHDDPHSTLGWCDDQTEFEFGLDLILDALERLAAHS